MNIVALVLLCLVEFGLLVEWLKGPLLIDFDDWVNSKSSIAFVRFAALLIPLGRLIYIVSQQ